MGTPSEQGELIAEQPLSRVERDVASALRRKAPQEAILGGVLLTLAQRSARVAAASVQAARTLSQRGAYERPLYRAAIRALSCSTAPGGIDVLCGALTSPSAGGLPTLSAAAACQAPEPSEALVRIVTTRQPVLVVAAEMARLARGESDGRYPASMAAKIKESHRIELCREVFVPLLWQPGLPAGAVSTLSVLRASERHLGRWLVLGELAARAGDSEPRQVAEAAAARGAKGTAGAAWALISWVLGGSGLIPRPTLEVMARLSDRPSSERDMTFLFRVAEARIHSARTALEALVQGSLTATGIRALFYLARNHQDEAARSRLQEAARSTPESLRGLCAAALWDLGEHELALEIAEELVESRKLSSAAWAMLVHLAAREPHPRPVLQEPSFRRLQLGWVE